MPNSPKAEASSRPSSSAPVFPLPDTVEEAERLVASIERAVQEGTSGGVEDLCVQVNRDGVLLTGRCETFYCKQLAQQAAMTMPGGQRLVNHIQVS
ncbi:MAG: BON domain-containing protein [Thermoguttaceae bacterium]